MLPKLHGDLRFLKYICSVIQHAQSQSQFQLLEVGMTLPQHVRQVVVPCVLAGMTMHPTTQQDVSLQSMIQTTLHGGRAVCHVLLVQFGWLSSCLQAPRCSACKPTTWVLAVLADSLGMEVFR